MDLEETSLGFYRAWHVALGVRHGMLLALRDVGLGAAALADELGLDARAVERWCEGAWALGLLTRSRGAYRLAKEHRETLGEPASPAYMGAHFHYLAQKSLTFGALDDVLAGRRVRVDLADTYALATEYDHVASLAALAPALALTLARGIDVLDLGAGRGGWTRAAMQRFPASRFSVADLESGPLRRLAGVSVHHAKRLPSAAFDLVYMGEVLAAAEDPVAVLLAAHEALRPGGRLVAVEGLRPEGAPRTWGERLVLAMGLDFSMDGSRFLSASEVKGALRATGFAGTRTRDLGGSLFLIEARKPQTRRAR